MARQFQGYARGRGFSSRNPGSAAVSRIQEQGNKTISGLRQQLQSKRQQDQQYIADLDSNFRRGEQIKDEIKSFEDKAFNLKMANVKRNQEQHLENIKTEAENQADTYKQLSAFSQTLGEAVVDVNNAIETAKYKGEFATVQLNLANPPSAAEKELEDTVRKGDAVMSDRLKTSVTQDGMPMATAQKAMADSPYKKLKNTDARIESAIQEVASTISITDHGPDFIHRILEKYNLYGVRPSRLYGLAQAYSKARSGFEQAKNTQLAVNTSIQTVNTAEANYINNSTKENLQAYQQALRSHTEDGVSFIDLNKVVNKLYETHLNEKFTDEDIQAFFNSPLLDANGEPLDRTFGEQFKDTRNVDLLNKREQNRLQAVKDRADVLKTEQQDNYLKTRDEIIKLGDQGNIDFETYKPMLDGLDVSEDQRNKLHEELYAISNQKVSNDALIAQADYLFSTGQDISQVVLGMTGKARSKYMDLNHKQQVAKTEAGIDDKAIRRTVKSALIKALGQQNVGDDKDPTLEIAIEDALIDIGKDTMINAPGSSLAQASSLALQQKLKEIQSGSGKYEVKGIGKGNDSSTGNYFSYYSVDGKYFTQVAKANSSEAIRAVRNRPDSRKDVFLVLTDDLATIYNAVQNNEGYQLPYALKELQKAYPDTVQLQLNKYADEFGKPRITVPLTYQQVLSARQEDTRAQRFMQQVETIQEERIIPLIADASTRMSDVFMAPNVGQRVASIRVRKPYEQLLSTIRSGEGSWTSANRGTAGDTPNGVPGLDRMTVSQWKDLQKNQGYFALGAYQFIPSTFAGAVKRAGFSEDTVMTPDNQDLLAIELIEGGTKRPVLSSYLNGTSDDVYAAAEDLAKEWAAVKTSKGTSAYEGVAGNSGSISQDRIVQLLMQIREMKQRG